MNVIVFEEDAYYQHLKDITRYIREKIIQPEWIGPADAAEMLNITVSSLKRYRDEGLITYSELSERKYLYSTESILKYIRQHKRRAFNE